MKIYKVNVDQEGDNLQLIYDDPFNLCKQSIKLKPNENWMIDNLGHTYTGTGINRAIIIVQGQAVIGPSIKSKWLGEKFQLHLDLRLEQNSADDKLHYQAQDGTIARQNNNISYLPIINCLLKESVMETENLITQWTLTFEEDDSADTKIGAL